MDLFVEATGADRVTAAEFLRRFDGNVNAAVDSYFSSSSSSASSTSKAVANHYDVLGVHQDATQSEIRKGFSVFLTFVRFVVFSCF